MQQHGLTANVIAGAAIALAFAFTAQALNNRSFVATTGNDANACTPSAYCRSFAAALAVTNPGGEIVVVNAGGYGPATINQSVVITAIGVDASITATSGNGLTINTTGNVTLNGLNLHGSGTANDGILVEQVGFLRLYSMLIENFVNNGIEVTAAGNLAIYDSKINDSGAYGLFLNNAPADAYVNNTAFDHNTLAGALAFGAGILTIAKSAAHYSGVGFWADSGGVLALESDRMIFNATGLQATNSGQISFTDCLVSDNTNSFIFESGGTITGSSPGTTLATPGQGSSGSLSSAATLQ
jgi:hypothetical protein